MVDDVESVWEEPVNDKRRVDYSNGKLKKGTLNSLILHLTSAEFQDIHFMKTFITTYRSFTTPIIFLKKLIQRYRVPSHYSSEHQLNIQLRICNILKHWIDTQPNDFDDSLISEFLSFIEEVKLTPTFHLYISSILSSLHKVYFLPSIYLSFLFDLYFSFLKIYSLLLLLLLLLLLFFKNYF